MKDYELRWLVETPSRDIRHYRMLNVSAVDGSTFSNGNKYLTKLKIKTNLRVEVKICISTYSNGAVDCYSATRRTALNERNSVCQVFDRS